MVEYIRLAKSQAIILHLVMWKVLFSVFKSIFNHTFMSFLISLLLLNTPAKKKVLFLLQYLPKFCVTKIWTNFENENWVFL